MTLKTFHFAGVASMNITLGVPCIKEILDAVKKIRTPVIFATLECETNVKFARLVAGRIEKTNLGQVAESMKIVMTTRSASIVVTLDMAMIQDAHLSIDANVQEHVKVLDVRKLEVVPEEADRSRLHFRLHNLKSMLPNVIVRGINTVQRVVINEVKEEKEDNKYKLLAEENTWHRSCEKLHHWGDKEYYEILWDEHRRSTYDLYRGCDDMGEVLGFTNFGAKKMEKGVLASASFEMPADHLFNGGVNGRVESVRGVSESIILGLPIQIGTGMFKVRTKVSSGLGQLTGSGPPHSDVQLPYGPAGTTFPT
ncbi:hypothetical protein L3X38_018950 [Prunus dulcis]|uniref:DNA-directed RNA polymerase n=2 Tax=Prunus dulcis TaxID=3755 RepID=A0AAD4WA62_PRUDU|nr:hypothetical protein L3X38_018950 [Prunus dulcis]